MPPEARLETILLERCSQSCGQSCSQSCSQSGFTLMETIVALALFSGVFVLLNQGLTASWQGKRRADQDVAAVALATAQLALAGVETPLVEGARTVGQQGAFNWDMMIEKYVEPTDDTNKEVLAGTATRAAAGAAVTAYWVGIEVSWPNGPLQKPRTLRLRTLKLGRP
jgi:prepilin-type N-terminal cleavage/methylation domain-containing protein